MNCIGSITFKKFSGENIKNVEGYVKKYCEEHKNIEVIVGTDSQNKGSRTIFSTIIAMHDKGDNGQGHGAHCLFCRWYTKRYKKYEIYNRMMAETESSINVAKSLRDAGIKIERIDIDINSRKNTGSNVAYEAARGWVESEGFVCNYKTDDSNNANVLSFKPLITALADWVVKS